MLKYHGNVGFSITLVVITILNYIAPPIECMFVAVMRTSRFTEERINYALKQVGGGTKVTELQRQMGVSQMTFDKLKSSLTGWVSQRQKG